MEYHSVSLCSITILTFGGFDITIVVPLVELRGIVGFIADKYAILHTIRSERVGAQNFDIDAVDHYAYQFRDQYMNNLTQNAIVFMVD